MEEQELIEVKRAHNFIWTAAEKYEFEPMFLAFSPDGTADMYLNLIIGLAYKQRLMLMLSVYIQKKRR